jgi:hypothetical protein
MKYLKLFLISVLLAVSQLSVAMVFETVGDTLVMSGPVVADDLARLKDHTANGKIKLIVLHRSNGGDLWNGLQIGRRIRSEGIPTAVSGLCASACGLMFLAGPQRSFSDGAPLRSTQVGLHGAHSRDTKLAISQVGPDIISFIRLMTDDQFSKELAQRTVYTNDPQDMVFFQHPLRFRQDGVPRGVIECLAQPDTKYKCTPIVGLDSKVTGVVTNPQVLMLSPEVKVYLATLAP